MKLSSLTYHTPGRSFEQGIARLHREGQKYRVCVNVLQTKMLATREDGSAYHTVDEQIWTLIQGKRELSEVAVDGKYDATDASARVQKGNAIAGCNRLVRWESSR